MKNYLSKGNFDFTKQLIRKMKTTCLMILVLASSLFASNVNSQVAKVSIAMKNAYIIEVIRAIENQTDYLFVYDKNEIDLTRRIDIVAENKSVTAILNGMFSNTNVVFALEGNNIMLMKKSETQQPQKTVSGKVTDSSGASLPGVSVVVKGTTNGTISDANGNYSLTNVPDNSSLQFSFVGMKRQDVVVGNKTAINITLEEDAIGIEEVVAVGYATQRKADLTGAVSVVKMDEIRTSPNANVMQTLQGHLPGVKIGADGTPGTGGVSIRIRGYGSLTNNDPLIIIDGLPTNNPADVSTLSQNEIESIQVLKDASSASIYGSRAANGVIIITTKKGKDGTKVSLESRIGVQTLARRIEMLDAQQYGDMLWQALKNDGKALTHPQYGTGPNATIPKYLENNPNVPAASTDWLREIFQNAITQTHTVALSNGSEKGSTLLSINYLNQDGLMITTNYERFSLRLNSEYKLSKALKIGENLSLSRAKTNMYSSSGAFQSSTAMFAEALAQQPLLPVYNTDGTYAGPMSQMGDARNPVARLNQTKDNNTFDSRAFGNIYVDLNILKDFTFRSNLAMDYKTTNGFRFEPKWAEGSRSNTLNSLTLSDQEYTSWVWSNVLNYNIKLNEIHQIDALIGTESAKFSRNFKTSSRQKFASETIDYQYLDAGEGTQSNSGYASVYTLLSYFGKVNYSLMDKYLLSATLRQDASSKLGSKNNSGLFPAFSVGWRISKESFLQNSDFITDLKLRYGWGRTGNQEIANYATFNTWRSSTEYTSYDINGTNTSAVPGYMVVQIGNPNLKWETTTQHNVGIDLSLWNNRIQSNVDYFYKKSTDMLIQPAVSAVVGEGAFPFVNGADMENKGFEFSIGLREKQGSEFKYNIDFNFDIIRNKVTKVNGVSYFEADGMARTLVGYPVSTFFGYIDDGLFQSDAEVAAHAKQAGAKPGLIKFRDVNGDGVINASDRTYMGNPHPNFSYGLNLGSAYKGFDVSFFFNGVQGNDIYTRSVRQRLDFYNNNYGRSTRVLQAWTPSNTNTKVPILSTGNPGDVQRRSTYFVEDGSYLKLKSLNIGYTFAGSLIQRASIANLHVFFQVQDVFTITKYEGTDPELRSNSNPLAVGVDNNLYPLPRTFTLGLNVSF